MSSDPAGDPFGAFDDQRTFVRPNPGAWAGGSRAPADDTQQAPAEAAPPEHGLNPLLAQANRLLMLAPQLRQTRHVADPLALRATLVHAVREFAANAQAGGIPPERVMAARYVLCTMLDEAAADTPWGGTGVWARHSLLAEFHNEAFGGEKVFQLMARLAEKPDANLDLLELIYAALALGFEGRYRVIDNGRAQLEAVRARLAQIIRTQRGAYPAALADHWAAQPAPERKLLSWLPLALTAGAVLLVLGGVYAALSWSLADRADPVYGDMLSLRLPPPLTPVVQPAPKPRLALFLAPDVRAGLVTVSDQIDRSVITIQGDGLFASGSASILPEREALVQRIAEALRQVGGPVLVTGHTDNTPMRSARFPSNWHLSQERAQTVRALMLQAGLPAARVQAEGRADAEPVQRNDTPTGRAQNRRVVITLTGGDARLTQPAPTTPAASGALP
ncbi:MAG: DotU family type VI secretion system protein [Proteobacteria bacterium]|nr:DotU family type VI secretion system protein [Pseudomonadota bacterium]